MKVILLGYDNKFLSNVVERVNSTRPVDVLYYTELKEFLGQCIAEQPDLVGISVGYPHKSIQKFPHVFKMALNVPVLVFGENDEPKTRKLLSSTNSDIKIQGLLTALNLWLKIVNLQKQLENEKNGVLETDGGGTNRGKQSNSVLLKGDKSKLHQAGNNSLLSKLFAELEGDDSGDNQSNMNIVSSSNATKFKKSSVNYVDSSGDPESLKKQSKMSHITGEGVSKNQKPTNTTPNTQSISMSDLMNDNFDSSTPEKTQSNANELSKQSAEERNPEDFSDRTNDIDGQENDENDNQGFDPVFNKDERLSNRQSSSLEKGSKKNSTPKKKKKFGRVQLSDEKQVKMEEERKALEKSKQLEEKNKNILKFCSEKALESTFGAKKISEKPIFKTERIEVFTVELGPFKGYLLFGTSLGELQSSETIELFRKNLIEQMQEKGLFGEISKSYLVESVVESYSFSVSEFSEFSINSQNDNMFLNVAFVKREVLTPVLADSEKENMFFVDIKVIPPLTPVNFEIFIHLPKNKRFVRYLKEGRSLSLKQAKRHAEDDGGLNKLYLPKDQKRAFEKFFIQNTLNWEFALHKKKEVS